MVHYQKSSSYLRRRGINSLFFFYLCYCLIIDSNKMCGIADKALPNGPSEAILDVLSKASWVNLIDLTKRINTNHPILREIFYKLNQSLLLINHCLIVINQIDKRFNKVSIYCFIDCHLWGVLIMKKLMIEDLMSSPFNLSVIWLVIEWR